MEPGFVCCWFKELKMALNKANPKDLEEALDNYTSPKIFDKLGYQMFIGEAYGQRCNYFRLKPEEDPNKGKFLVDFDRNLVDNPGNFLTPLPSYFKMRESGGLYTPDEIKNQETLVRENIVCLKEALNENLRQFGDNYNDYKGSTLIIPNKEIIKDLHDLFVLISELDQYRERDKLASPDFKEKANELIRHHSEEVVPRYKEYDQKLSEYYKSFLAN